MNLTEEATGYEEEPSCEEALSHEEGAGSEGAIGEPPVNGADEDEDETGTVAEQRGAGPGLAARLDGIDAALADLASLFRAKIDRSEYELETLRKQSDEIQEYRSDLYGKLITPLLQGVIQAHAGMLKTVERFSATSDGEPKGSVPIDTLKIYCEQLEDLLEDNGVERFSIASGDEFSSGDMRIVGKIPTSDNALIGTVAEVAGCGYRLNGKPFEPARVKVYIAE